MKLSVDESYFICTLSDQGIKSFSSGHYCTLCVGFSNIDHFQYGFADKNAMVRSSHLSLLLMLRSQGSTIFLVRGQCLTILSVNEKSLHLWDNRALPAIKLSLDLNYLLFNVHAKWILRRSESWTSKYFENIKTMWCGNTWTELSSCDVRRTSFCENSTAHAFSWKYLFATL